MTLLLRSDSFDARRAAARGPLAPIASGLLEELQPLLDRPPDVPTEKALLSRAGGRCAVDGALLEYDPFDPHHRCPRCGREYSGVEHDRFRLYWHHLWLAERALHGALLSNLLGHPGCEALATKLLERYADRYLEYPNRDNVLGPSRPFFSTYLESIWLLQLVLALDLLEATPTASPTRASLGARVRERLVVPSADLIASFDEGMSNRQVWNNAALLAAGRMLGRTDMVERAVTGPSGLLAHLDHALLADGSWYEGENYHLFAHRGLWYAVQLAERGGYALPPALEARFMAGFAAPFRTVLPDLTYPSRRDSQYAVSVRQLRFAESCELGLARGDDRRLTGMLARLYDGTVPHSRTGRATSSADVERNLPATGLSRADLSWRSLLFARETLPPLEPTPLRSDLLPAQGFAVLRRGAVYAALDFGHPGGGHGHPDRLNLLLMDGETRWFDDPGTGSYVDRSLHWYRSTLAHTAPLIDGRSQPRVHGSLVAFDDQPRGTWVCADAELTPGLHLRRSIVLLDDYLVDLLQWEGDAPHDVALPLHGIDLVDDTGAPLARTAMAIVGGDGLEDGFDFLERTSRLESPSQPFARARSSGATGAERGKVLEGWIRAEPGADWWSADAPDVPSRPGMVRMLMPRVAGVRGSLLAVWSWDGAVTDVAMQGQALDVRRRDGRRDSHAVVTEGWRIDMETSEGARDHVFLRGLARSEDARESGEPSTVPPAPSPLPASFRLGESHYRRSEESWDDAGAPGATVTMAIEPGRVLAIAALVEPSSRLFVPAGTENALDNEPAAINGDGAQLYLACGAVGGAWLLVPQAAGDTVWISPLTGWGAGLAPVARWRATAAGYRLEVRVALPQDCTILALDLLINETAPGRARRRGQLVLSGAQGEFVYLRGDRHDPHRLLRFTISDV
jgi:hypothetical protein